MKTSKIQMLVLGLVLVTSTSAIAQWKPAGDNLKTSWGENINPDKVWQEYPRPIMERSEWQNLNGFWNYAIVPADSVEPMPDLSPEHFSLPHPLTHIPPTAGEHDHRRT